MAITIDTVSKEINQDSELRAALKGCTVKKCYKFGKFGDAELTTFNGTKIVRVVLRDPVGQFENTVRYFSCYEDGYCSAKMHSQMANALYGRF